MQPPPAGRTLLPFFPMIYVAWASGSVSGEELEAIHQRMADSPDLDADSRLVLAGWLDPESPPTPKRLNLLLASVREAARDLPDSARASLVELGRAIARRQGEDGVATALRELEEALGAAGAGVPEELVGSRDEAAEPDAPRAFDPQALQRLLDGRYREAREEMRGFLAEPEFRHEYGLPRAAYRERVLGWARALARRGVGFTALPKEVGGRDDTGAFLAMFEVLATFDLSLLIKSGVQFGLFGGSVHHLGTERHHREYLPRIASLELPGCFAMTETGHGSNVRDLETVARYDRERQQFVIHTPGRSARKDYIGNAAAHGRMATVFAQLEIDGEGYGVHAFLVPLRDEQNGPLPGIEIEDDGEKIGLNGVDNGRISFHHVRVPRENLLDRFAQVSPEGDYTSPILGESERFFTMLATLVMGRISIAAGALSAAKSGLAIAVRYGAVRRQFGPPGHAEIRLLDYPSHQRRLMPLLANAFALDFAVKHLVETYTAPREGSARRLEGLAAGLKAWGTWNAVETLQTCRECCGGQGYLAENRFGALKADTDVFTTFEGDNTVLMQLVAKGLLTDFRLQFSELSFLGLVKYLSRLAATALTDQNPLAVRNVDPGHLRDVDFHLGALRFREKTLLVSLARRMKRQIEGGASSYEAFNALQDHVLALARAHVERQIHKHFAAGVAGAEADLQPVLGQLCALFALSRIERDRAWFLEAGYLEPAKSKALRAQVLALAAEVREQAVPLVDSFGLMDKCLAAPIAFLAG